MSMLRWKIQGRHLEREAQNVVGVIFHWRYPGVIVALFLGVGLAMASLAQNTHQVWLVHLGFGLAYLFFIMAAVWSLGAWITSDFLDRKDPHTNVWDGLSLTAYRGWKWGASIGIVILLAFTVAVTGLFHKDKSLSLRLQVIPPPPPPLITLKLTPASFPVSVPGHSALFILPLHPFQTFTDESPQLHIFDNTCGDSHIWPTPEEVSSKPKDAHEEVRVAEITNHSQRTIDSAKAVFDVTYNAAFAGGCTPPANTTLQHDVIAIPPLDPGKGFQFVVVNQTTRCAWLMPPRTIQVRTSDEDTDKHVPLKTEAQNIPGWESSPFVPTSVKWQGVPTKNPGYGLVRSSARCDTPEEEKSSKPKDDGLRETTGVKAVATVKVFRHIEGLRITEQKEITSLYPDGKYAVQVTIETETSIQPVHLRIQCDGPLRRVDLREPQRLYQYSYGVAPGEPNVAIVTFQFPPMDKEHPVVVALVADQKIRATAVRKVE